MEPPSGNSHRPCLLSKHCFHFEGSFRNFPENEKLRFLRHRQCGIGPRWAIPHQEFLISLLNIINLGIIMINTSAFYNIIGQPLDPDSPLRHMGPPHRSTSCTPAQSTGARGLRAQLKPSGHKSSGCGRLCHCGPHSKSTAFHTLAPAPRLHARRLSSLGPRPKGYRRCPLNLHGLGPLGAAGRRPPAEVPRALEAL